MPAHVFLRFLRILSQGILRNVVNVGFWIGFHISVGFFGDNLRLINLRILKNKRFRVLML